MDKHAHPHWKNSHSLSERPAYLCIMATQFEGPLKPLNTILLRCTGSLNWSPMMPTDCSLSDSCTPARCSFSTHGARYIGQFSISWLRPPALQGLQFSSSTVQEAYISWHLPIQTAVLVQTTSALVGEKKYIFMGRRGLSHST